MAEELVYRKAVIFGRTSEIGIALMDRLVADKWIVWTYTPRTAIPDWPNPWELLLIPVGTLEPIGPLLEINPAEWERGMLANCMVPLRALRSFWPLKGPKATVVFFGGPNMAKPSPTYSAYRAGKAVLESLVTTLEAENPGTRFRILHPGVVNTKIHQQTLQAGERAANYERVKRIVAGEESTVSHDEVYEKLKELL